MAALPKVPKKATGCAPEEKKKYVPPRIITYTQDEVIEIIGPALACTPADCYPSIVSDF